MVSGSGCEKDDWSEMDREVAERGAGVTEILLGDHACIYIMIS